MSKVLSVSALSKRYGSIRALDSFSLEVNQGEVYGILGPNGSGKTTTLGILLDVLKADSGTYSWFDGMPTVKARRQIGSILETPNFYPYLSARQNLAIACTIKEVGTSDIDRVLKEVNLYERRHDKFETYSLGMKQRLALASAMLGDPDVLILDEPTNGLDPLGIAEVRGLILQQAQKGATIIMASHILDEVEKTCSHVAVFKIW